MVKRKVELKRPKDKLKFLKFYLKPQFFPYFSILANQKTL
jgi:hypothetical protein